ncbi:GNAT family N-acetyltransferase [Metabacillus malikii]|uniref:Ribosomal protein S18 acetylase RimI-like enzyme n=1 Tax=Metabacillus malikii TaxID=1504265 RepID=A0ABT9ZH39_9BACI|nr:GNAT family N-acetyltransferase [Metabacillus malikii]MDQ0230853.1 ribosomal protein S18 acetylase RimI-like enzyme [Metabacillus malikii]
MEIRKANQLETQQLIHLSALVMEESSMGQVKNSLENSQNAFMPLLNNGAYYLIATHHQHLCGWILIGPDFNPIHYEKTGSIISLYVYPEYRKHGIGKQLMLHALNEFRMNNYKKVQLNVFSGNPAKQLYESLGFYDISTIMEHRLV